MWNKLKILVLLFLFSISSFGQITVTYYFNSYGAENWDGGEAQLVDGNTSTFSYDNNNGHYIDLSSNTCLGSNLGTISKVEISAFFENNYDANSTRTIAPRLIPYFGGSSIGSNYDYPNGNYDGSGGYPALGSYFDITNDANAPVNWTWSDVQDLNCRLVSNRPNSGQHRVSKVLIQVTYTPNTPDCNWELCLSDSYGDGWNGGSIEVIVGGVSIGSWTLNSGSGPGCIDIPINIGDDIELNYTAGSWSYENIYFLYDSYGNQTYASGDDGTTPVDYTYSSADCDPHPLTPTVQDCLGAISICGDSYTTTTSYSGIGNVGGEINGGSSCLASGERNDVWYIFTVQQDGDLLFTISPNNAADDYDWAVYNLTNSNCTDIATDLSIEVSCNYSGISGDTGPDGSTALSSQGAGGTPFNDGIPVLTGEVYVINVSNYSSTQDGYFIDFSMASGVIIDVTPPELQTIVSAPSCGEDQITAWFTELVDTSTVNAGDFVVTGPGGPYLITEVHGTGGVDMDREYSLTLDAQLIAGGTYTLVFSGQVDDACGNSVTGNSLDFTVTGISGSTVVVDGAVLCFDDAVGSTTASASGGSGTYSYLWDDGQTTATINNLVAGAYTVTVSDDVGVCYDVVDAVINPSNPLISVGTWAGSANSDWNDCENWGGGFIPLSSMDVVVPIGCSNYPVLSVNTTISGTIGICNSIRVQNGGTLTIDNDKNLIIDNAVFLVEAGGALFVSNDLRVQNSGNLAQSGGIIEIDGDFINNSTFNSSGGEFLYSGTNRQTIEGSQICNFYNLTLNNLNGLVLEIDVRIDNNLTLTNGDLNIKDNVVDLGTAGTLVGETSNSRIIALDGGGFPINGGYISATRTDPSGNIAGLGLDVSPSSALGSTTIKRGHDELSGSGSFVANSSILRNYEITSSAKSVTTFDCVFSYYDNELNGHIDGNLIVFQEVQYSSGPIYWAPLTTVNDGAANTATATTVNNGLSTTKITLGSDIIPLPINLVEFKASCENYGVELFWSTSSEVNNSHFTIEKSYDGLVFDEIDYVYGSGNTNEVIAYSYLDYNQNDKTNYYRLKQTDFDEKFTVSEIIKANCTSVIFGEETFSVYPNPVNKGTDVFVEIKGFDEESEVLVVVLDILGQQQYSKILLTDMSGSTVTAIDNLNRLPSGTYIIIGSSNDLIYKKKLIINK